MALHRGPQLRQLRHTRDEALHLLLPWPGCRAAIQVWLRADSPCHRRRRHHFSNNRHLIVVVDLPCVVATIVTLPHVATASPGALVERL